MRLAAYKHSSKHGPIEEAAGLEDQSVWTAQKPPTTDQTVIRKEMSECVVEFVDNLPSDYKTVIVLSELDGLANKEIAEILGISLDNVKVRLHRARAKLKATLNATDFSAMKESLMKKMMEMYCGSKAEDTKTNTESQKKT